MRIYPLRSPASDFGRSWLLERSSFLSAWVNGCDYHMLKFQGKTPKLMFSHQRFNEKTYIYLGMARDTQDITNINMCIYIYIYWIYELYDIICRIYRFLYPLLSNQIDNAFRLRAVDPMAPRPRGMFRIGFTEEHHTIELLCTSKYTLWWTNIAMENCHRNGGFSH